MDQVDHCMFTLLFGGVMWLIFFPRRDHRSPKQIQRAGCMFLLATFVVSMLIGAWTVWALITRL